MDCKLVVERDNILLEVFWSVKVLKGFSKSLLDQWLVQSLSAWILCLQGIKGIAKLVTGIWTWFI